MPKRLSESFRISAERFDELGVFNSFIDVDSRLYIDPSLLENSLIPEFVNSYKTFEEYFQNVLFLLDNSSTKKDLFWRNAYKKLIFREAPYISLGYSKRGSHGSGIGPKIALSLIDTCYELIKKGIKSPKLFELIGVLEEGVGADRISDLTIRIIFLDLIRFTERISKDLKLTTYKIRYSGNDYSIPLNSFTKKPLLFVPKEFLRNIPIALDWSDIDRVCSHNDELRRKVNGIIGDSWNKATKQKKSLLKKVVLQNPDLMNDLITLYTNKSKDSYDFVNDPAGEVNWYNSVEKAAKEFPLNLKDFDYRTEDFVCNIVQKICGKFKELIEENGWFELIYEKGSKTQLLNERYPQKLFYGIADSYCESNNLDLSRESNGGIGPVDFKISYGYKSRVLVEVKYASNPNLIKGFQKQLPSYAKSEKTESCIYLVIKSKNKHLNLDNLIKYANDQRRSGKKVPDIIIIDGNYQVSASKRK